MAFKRTILSGLTLIIITVSLCLAQKPSDIATKAEQAASYLDKEQYSKAISLYDQILAANPSKASYYGKASKAYLARVTETMEGDTSTMRDMLFTSHRLAQQAIQRDSQSALGYTYYGISSIMLGGNFAHDSTKQLAYFGKFFQAVRQLQSFNPDLPASWYLRGMWHRVYADMGAIKKAGANAKFNLPAGGEWKNALRCFRNAYRQYEKQGEKLGAQYFMAKAHYEMGDLKKAKKNAEQVRNRADPAKKDQQKLIDQSKEILKKIEEEKESWW